MTQVFVGYNEVTLNFTEPKKIYSQLNGAPYGATIVNDKPLSAILLQKMSSSLVVKYSQCENTLCRKQINWLKSTLLLHVAGLCRVLLYIEKILKNACIHIDVKFVSLLRSMMATYIAMMCSVVMNYNANTNIDARYFAILNDKNLYAKTYTVLRAHFDDSVLMDLWYTWDSSIHGKFDGKKEEEPLAVELYDMIKDGNFKTKERFLMLDPEQVRQKMMQFIKNNTLIFVYIMKFPCINSEFSASIAGAMLDLYSNPIFNEVKARKAPKDLYNLYKFVSAFACAHVQIMLHITADILCVNITEYVEISWAKKSPLYSNMSPIRILSELMEITQPESVPHAKIAGRQYEKYRKIFLDYFPNLEDIWPSYLVSL